MSLYHAAETLIVTVVVAGCALSVLARYMPRTRERVKARLASAFGGAQATGWRAGLIRRLAPKTASGCASGCDSGGCNTCGSNESETDVSTGGGTGEQPIRFVKKP